MRRIGVVLDSSVIVAVLCREPGWEDIFARMETFPNILVGAPTVAETQVVASTKSGYDASKDTTELLDVLRALIVPFDRDHVKAFQHAYMRYGKGRHPARLNPGDPFSYATASVADMPLLFIGNDFTKTDIRRG